MPSGVVSISSPVAGAGFLPIFVGIIQLILKSLTLRRTKRQLNVRFNIQRWSLRTICISAALIFGGAILIINSSPILHLTPD
jgi:hypothetical protein